MKICNLGNHRPVTIARIEPGKPMTRAEVLAAWKPQPFTLGNHASYAIARIEPRKCAA